MNIETANRLQNVQEYYFSKKLREVAQLKKEGKSIINMAIGSPDLQPPMSVLQALKDSLQLPNVHQYQSYQGIPELREAMVHFYKKKYNVVCTTEEVLPLMGSKEGIMHISMAFLNKGDEVLVPNPGYPTYASVTRLVEATPVFYELTKQGGWLPNLEELEKKNLSKVKLMWINYPNMPTGAIASKKALEKLINFAKKHHILLINDNPYSFILNNHPTSIFQVKGAKEVTLELNSLSKTFNMAGWRVGMVLGNKNLISKILQVKSNMDSGMFLGIQKGAVEAFKTSDEWFQNQNKIYGERREKVWTIFDKLGCTYNKDTSGLFVWAKIPKGTTEEEMVDELLYKKNIFIVPGTVFGSAGKGYVRASLCISKENLDEVIKRISK